MMRRRPLVVRRPGGLIGTMARTAVVAGTATVTANAINKRQMGKQQAAADEAAAEQAAQQQDYDQQQQIAQLQAQLNAQQAPPPAAAPPAAAPGGDMMAQLNQLAQLKASGVLSDAEFAAAKAKLLGS
ncbi:putative membrane protein [Allocatelliglobosispora scoriae]|uniref:Putative membrane protein n=1 Tax=Allocatelliglobosispora scoriae TaxID=643052 RepID=A0A841BYF1_9ACTN|nr:SHOCT domain-containing protein [Allocatelliglobosispora scoriae]MBB5871822.1 putative membrane protein [Allocatelliglobosispora scoriae]